MKKKKLKKKGSILVPTTTHLTKTSHMVGKVHC